MGPKRESVIYQVIPRIKARPICITLHYKTWRCCSRKTRRRKFETFWGNSFLSMFVLLLLQLLLPLKCPRVNDRENAATALLLLHTFSAFCAHFPPHRAFFFADPGTTRVENAAATSVLSLSLSPFPYRLHRHRHRSRFNGAKIAAAAAGIIVFFLFSIIGCSVILGRKPLML